MRKLLTLCTALFLLGSMSFVQADYYVAGTMTGWNAGDANYKMSGSNPYSVTKQLNTGSYQFKITNGSWGWSTDSYDQSASNVTLSSEDGNIAFSLTTTCDVTFYYNPSSTKAYVQATPVVVPTYTFPANTVIYYDFTAYNGGVNVCINGQDVWHENTSAIFSETLNNAWEVTATTNLFKSAPPSNSWTYKTCSTLPTEGQNMLVGDADGIGCHWDTYTPAPPAPDVYTVVGTVPGLDWNQEGTSNDMAENAGVYTRVLENVALAVGTYEYKMVKNHSWDVSYPQTGNASFSITEAGIYNVTFALNLSASPEYSVTPELIEATVIIPTVEAKGSWDEWENALVFEGDATSASVTKHLAKGDYDFKVIVGSSWRSNAYAYHRDYTGTSDITGNEDANMVLEADVEGDYTFTWTYENNALNIGFPECDYYIKNNWYGCGAWKWKGMTAAGDGTYRIENVVYGGNGVNYNTTNADAGATWKEQSVLFYMDGTKRKEVMAYDTVNFVLDPANDTVWAEMVSKDLTVYTVASNSLALCDLGWAATHPYKYTDMTKQADGTYQWTKGGDEVLLPAGKIYIKVIKDRDYENGYWPTTEEGFEYTIQQSGIYTIEVNFNPCTQDITIDTTLVKTVNVKDLYIQGFGDLKSLIKDGDNYKALATISLAAGTHNFSLVDGGSNKLGNGQAFTRENNSIHGIVAENGADMTIEVDKAGEYLFTYIFEYDQLMIRYPANVPAVKIAPIGGKFTINAKGDTAVFSRGNLQYNYEADEWYTAEKQYEVLGDLNLRFGDATYQGSIDLFGWSCESSDYGKQWKYRDEDFTGDFVDWGHLFDGGDQEWSTLSEAEWNFILARKQGSRKLWTMITLGPDSLNGLALFPDDWTAPACASEMVYGFYDLDNAVNYKKNAFTFAEWAEMEAAGAVFFPLAGARAGYWGNNWSGTAVSDLSNPLSSGYDWVDNENWMGYYWLNTVKSETQISSAILPGWHNNLWTAPTIWARERRRGQPVRLVTIIPKNDYEVVRPGLTAGNYYTVCYNKTMKEIRGASLWSFTGKDADMAYIVEAEAPYAAGTPYLIYAESEALEAILETVDDPVAGHDNGLYGTFSYMSNADLAGNGATHMLKNNAICPIGAGYLDANRAYIKLDEIGEPAPAPGRRVRAIPLQKNTPTGIDALNASETPVKMLIDGQIYILRGEKIYNVNGQVVK